MVRQYGKLLLLASMVLLTIACSKLDFVQLRRIAERFSEALQQCGVIGQSRAKYPMTQSEDFRWNRSNHLGGES